jgi:hypothetical protein
MSASPVTHAPGVHTFETPQRFLGLEVGARMTVLETDGGLVVHSPVAVDPSVIAALGTPRWVVSPNKLHHLHAGPWLAAGLEGWAAPGLPEKRPDLRFAGVLDSARSPFGPDVAVFPLTCFPMANEVVLLHRPSRTLVVTDLVFHFTPAAPWLTRAAFTALCGYPGCQCTVLERVAFHRPTARRELRALLDEDFDRLVMAHGAVIETGGHNALAAAFRWLGA